MEETKVKIKTRAILEIMGAPKEHVEKTMSLVLGKVKDNKDMHVYIEKTSEPAQVEGRPYWSMFTELEIGFKDEDGVMGFCFDFMPSSIEIIEPMDFKFKKDTLENLFNDLVARLHHYDMMIKNIHAQNMILKQDMEKLKLQSAQPKPSDVVEDKKD
jgi:hypothetical protein